MVRQTILRHHCNGMLQWGREMGLNSENNIGEWGAIATQEQGGGQWVENH